MEFADGRLGIVVADVTDKGVPAALVMATARSLIRSAAERLIQPGEILRRANDQLSPDIPPKMFVTCLYILLDPATGDLTLANAGHNLPIWSSKDGVQELRATGMPLGLLPGMGYTEIQAHLDPGDRLLLYSDGIVEAHNTRGEMFGFSRLREIIAGLDGQTNVTAALMDQLVAFTGPGWEQEDDVTLLNIERLPPAADMETRMAPLDEWVMLDEFTLPSAPGNERLAMQRVADAVVSLPLEPIVYERLKTAVAESTMNAMEHGNKYRDDLPAEFQVLRSSQALMVRITDFGGGKGIPDSVQPDLDAKLEGLQSPRGWGLFLIQNMVDEMRVQNDGFRHTVELILKLEAQNE
jgi:anti-sigma regulatory factor (Ser/Thr protein kinase)